MTYLLFFIVFIIGLAFGSALLCAAMRFGDGEVWWKGRSRCGDCKKTLTWDQLIPVLSFLIYKGVCKNCKTKLSWFYPLFEVIAGFASVVVLMRFLDSGDSWMLVRDIVIVLVALFAMGLDWYKMLVSTEVVVIGAVIVLLIPSVLTWTSLLLGVCIGFSFFGLQYLITKGRGIGSGDMFLGVFMGAALGWPSVLLAIFIAYIMGSIHAIYLLGVKKAGRKTKLSLGLYLMLGVIVVMAIELTSFVFL